MRKNFKVSVENMKALVTELLENFDESFNKNLSEDEAWMKSDFAVNPSMAFDDYKIHVEFRFDGELYSLLHGDEYITSFVEIWENAMKGKSWDWYSSSIINIYK